MSVPQDHEVLDVIANALDHCGDISASRERECVEFLDLKTRKWFEIVVREIDGPSDILNR